jgi:hypothetical protein
MHLTFAMAAAAAATHTGRNATELEVITYTESIFGQPRQYKSPGFPETFYGKVNVFYENLP